MNIGMTKKNIAPVSVVIPCFCCSKTIERAVDSVASQTLLPKELILIEDASSDNNKTINALNSLKEFYSSYFDIKIIFNQTNIGAGESRNCGWDLAVSEYIAFLDADDVWHPDKLKIQFEFMKSNQRISISGHSHQIKSSVSEPWSRSSPFQFKVVRKWSLFFSNQFCTPSVMLKREIPFRFLKGKRYAEDYLLWIQICLSDFGVAKLDIPLVATFKENFGSSGLSSYLIKMQLGEIDCYWNLYKLRLINLILFFALCVYSAIKFFRRLVLTGFRKILGLLK